MMREELRCEVVQDLLPSYVDGLTRKVTTQAINEHLASCGVCRQIYERMKTEGDNLPENEQMSAQNKKDIDYLKKIRTHNRLDIIIVTVVLLVMFAALCYRQIFIIGTETSIDDIDYEITSEDGTYRLNMQFADYSLGTGRMEISEEDGVVDISVYSLRKWKGSTFGYAWCPEDCWQISVDGVIIWADGEMISRKTSDIYQTKTEYIGDIVACKAVADAIGIQAQFGSYENELTTSAQPYDWRLIIAHPLQTDKKEAAEQKMFEDACVLLGMISNLDSVTWDYITNEGEQIVTITKEAASEYVGYDVKSCSKSAGVLQKLLLQLGIILEENTYIEMDPLGGVPYGFEISVSLQSDSDIDHIVSGYYLDDEFLNAIYQYFTNGSNSKAGFWSTEVTDIVDTDFLGKRLTDEELKRMTLEIIVVDKDGNEYPVSGKKVLAAEYGGSYEYELKGNFKDGFTLREKQEGSMKPSFSAVGFYVKMRMLTGNKC
ncbi:MAG: DUF4825 domain-containing protein [Coprococcus sp.]